MFHHRESLFLSEHGVLRVPVYLTMSSQQFRWHEDDECRHHGEHRPYAEQKTKLTLSYELASKGISGLCRQRHPGIYQDGQLNEHGIAVFSEPLVE